MCLKPTNIGPSCNVRCSLQKLKHLLLSLGRVVPAPHTRHLLGLFAAIAQNSLLRSLSIVDFFARKQHYCRGSEELAIRKSARLRAELLRRPPSYSEWGAPKNSEQFRATPSCSEPFRASNRECQAPWKSQEAWYSQLLELRALQAAPSYSEWRPRTASYSERLRAATHSYLSFHNSNRRATSQASELLRATPS